MPPQEGDPGADKNTDGVEHAGADTNVDDVEHAGADMNADDVEHAGADMNADDVEPTPQTAALRRQQSLAAISFAVLAGLAVTVSILQRYPSYTLLAVLAGIVSAVFVYRLATRSVFPGEEHAS